MRVQIVDPGAEFKPLEQGEQVVALDTLLKVPAAHRVQVDCPAAENEPGVHWLQVEVAEPDWKEPAAQFWQAVTPVRLLKVPGAQVDGQKSDTVVGTVEKRPVGHPRQEKSLRLTYWPAGQLFTVQLEAAAPETKPGLQAMQPVEPVLE